MQSRDGKHLPGPSLSSSANGRETIASKFLTGGGQSSPSRNPNTLAHRSFPLTQHERSDRKQIDSAEQFTAANEQGMGLEQGGKSRQGKKRRGEGGKFLKTEKLEGMCGAVQHVQGLQGVAHETLIRQQQSNAQRHKHDVAHINHNHDVAHINHNLHRSTTLASKSPKNAANHKTAASTCSIASARSAGGGGGHRDGERRNLHHVPCLHLSHVSDVAVLCVVSSVLRVVCCVYSRMHALD